MVFRARQARQGDGGNVTFPDISQLLKACGNATLSPSPCRALYAVFQKSRESAWRSDWPVFCRMLCTCTFTVLSARCMDEAMF